MFTMLISEKYLPLRTCRRIVILVFTHVAHTYANLLKQRKCLRCLRRIFGHQHGRRFIVFQTGRLTSCKKQARAWEERKSHVG